MIIVNRWEGRAFGVIPTREPARTDHVCQACGAGFSLQPQLLLWFLVGTATSAPMLATAALTGLVGAPIAFLGNGVLEGLVSLVLSFGMLLFGSATLYFTAGPQVHAWLNPVVPGAVVPAQIRGPISGLRRCSCGAGAVLVRQRAFALIRFPAGTESTFRCVSCQREFTVPSGWALVVRGAMAAALGLTTLFLAALLPFVELRPDHFVVLGVLALGCLVGALLVAGGIYQRARHPVV